MEISIDSDISIKVYTKGIKEEFIGIEIIKDNEEIFKYFNLDNLEIHFLIDNKNIDITLSDKSIDVTIDNIKILKVEKNKNTYNFQISNILNNYQGSLTTLNDNITFSMIDTNRKENNIEITGTIKYGNEEISINTLDSVDITDLTSEEKEDIKTSIYNIFFNNSDNNILNNE